MRFGECYIFFKGFGQHAGYPALPPSPEKLEEDGWMKRIGYEEKEHWCTINYYELNQRLGIPFNAELVTLNFENI